MKYKYAILQGWDGECFLLDSRFMTLADARGFKRDRQKRFPSIPWMTIINLKDGQKV